MNTATAARPERGMATAEIAIGVLGVVFLTFLAAWTVMLAVVQTRCGDVAAEVARQLARGDTAAATSAGGKAPAGSQLSVRHTGSTVVVTVTADESFGRVGPVHLTGRAVATLEPGVGS